MLYQACGQMLLAFPAHMSAERRRHPHGVFTAVRTAVAACGAMEFLSQILMTRGMQRVEASASIARLSGLPWSFLFRARSPRTPCAAGRSRAP